MYTQVSDTMLVSIRFIRRVGDGYFGRCAYQDVVCPNIVVRDFVHACVKVRATIVKHRGFYVISGAYFPCAWITLPDGQIVRVDVSRTGEVDCHIMAG
jgi:hypothetical protein